jgi:hypothetical protein
MTTTPEEVIGNVRRGIEASIWYRGDFELRFRDFTFDYPVLFHLVKAVGTVLGYIVNPVNQVMVGAAWTQRLRNESARLLPSVRAMKAAYMALGRATQTAISAQAALTAAGRHAEALQISRVIPPAQAELRRVDVMLEAWRTSGLEHLGGIPRWMAYLTPVHEAMWAERIAREYGPVMVRAIERAAVGPVETRPEPKPEPEPEDDSSKWAMAAAGLLGLVWLKKRKKKARR